MTTDRVVCSQCGANNFATQAACWKCGTTLGAAPSPSAPPRPAVAVAPAQSTAPHADSPAALWSSIALGVLFPVISLPVGLVFLMLDDRRKAQIGWWNILAGVIGTVLNVLLAFATIMPWLSGITKGFPLSGLRNSAATPDLGSEASPPDLPGIPNNFSRLR